MQSIENRLVIPKILAIKGFVRDMSEKAWRGRDFDLITSSIIAG
jgi:hypothetical protein